MSRVGKKPIAVPKGVEVKISTEQMEAKGPKGQLVNFIPEGISISREGDNLIVKRANDESPKLRALHGVTRAVLNNMVSGVSVGFTRELQMVGVGYRGETKGTDTVELQLGFSHPVVFKLPKGITASIDKATSTLKLSGCDKGLLGETAAKIRSIRPPEPYKGKGIKYAEEVIRRKAGKAATTGAGAK